MHLFHAYWCTCLATSRVDIPISDIHLTPTPSYHIESPTVTRNHTCSLHIRRDEKSKLKGHKFGFLEKGTNRTQPPIS